MEVLSRGWQTELALLQRAGSEVEHHPLYTVVRTTANPASHWGNFLLLRRAPLRRDAARALDTFAQELPGSAHVSIGIDDPEGTVADLAPLVDLGLEVDRSVVLTAADVAPVRPPQVAAVIRPLRSDADWQARLELHLHVAGSGTGDGYRRFLGRRVAGQRELTETGAATWLGAFASAPAGGLLAGAGIVSAGRGLARYQEVETHPSWRRHGLARALVHAAGRHAVDRLGASSLVVVADPGHHAARLYRGLGFSDTEVRLQAHRAARR